MQLVTAKEPHHTGDVALLDLREREDVVLGLRGHREAVGAVSADPLRQILHGEVIQERASATARSTQFSSSRTLPGQS